jgi:tRNA G18 (ribose-2'-O)-methylase SpoU
MPNALRGYCGIGIEHGKTAHNIGTLWRTADLFDVDFLFTVGARYTRQPSDTMRSWKHIPLWNFQALQDIKLAAPLECAIVGVELVDGAFSLETYTHPERAIYLLGAEDHGLTKEALKMCHHVIRLPGRLSMNVAVAGSIVLYDRLTKADRFTQRIAMAAE